MLNRHVGFLLSLSLLLTAPSQPATAAPWAAAEAFILQLAPGAALPPGLTVIRDPSLAKVGMYVVSLPANRASAAEWPGVLALHPNAEVHVLDLIPDDPEWGRQYAPALLQLPQAWPLLSSCLPVTIAIIDTGLDLAHPDLMPRLWTNPGESGLGREGNGLDDDGNGYVDDWRGWDFVSDDNLPQDDHNHGTHVAGIAGAEANNHQGIAGVAGVGCPARLLPLKVLSASGSGTDADVASAVVYAADQGARVINLSLGDTAQTPAIEVAIDYAVAHGALVAAAAGNSGGSGIYYPAAYNNALAVASTTSNNDRSFFSSFGPQIDVAAPGSSIYSAVPGNLYGYSSGTSMATPQVAGVAALLASQPQFDTPAKIRTALEATALDLGPLCWDPYVGAGLVQAAAALAYTPGAPASGTTCYYTFVPWFQAP